MKVVVMEIKNLSVKEYLEKIKPYLRYIMIGFQKSDTWKIQLKWQLTLFLLNI